MCRRIVLTLIILLEVGFFLAAKTHAQTVLFDWNEPSAIGTEWPGWRWYPGGDGEGANDFGSPGWRMLDGQFMSGCCDNWLPRSQAINGYDNDNLAEIITIDRAPSTSDGGCLRVYDTGNGNNNQAGWWLYLGDDNFGNTHSLDSTINRMDFYLKLIGTDTLDVQKPYHAGVHVGTYLCWDGGGSNGESCPKEASNQHYYHYLGLNPGAWIHIVLNRHPQHQRNVGIKPDNYTLTEIGRHYFPSMNRFYVEIRYPQTNLTSYLIDEIRFYSTRNTEEHNQNDISVSSAWVGYWKDKDWWEIGFQDMSFGQGGYNDASGSTFEIRYSSEPITNENYDLASLIKPMYHSAADHPHLVQRWENWVWNVWTRFELPDEFEEEHDRIYFAIKDVSVMGGHVGPWPHHLGDGHDAPSDLIHTIDYHLRPATDPTTSVGGRQKQRPESIELTQNYPNPFNPETTIRYQLPFAGNVTIVIYDSLGRLVTTLEAGFKEHGAHSAMWDGRTESGDLVGSGVYFYRLNAVSLDGKVVTASKKMLLLR